MEEDRRGGGEKGPPRVLVRNLCVHDNVVFAASVGYSASSNEVMRGQSVNMLSCELN